MNRATQHKTPSACGAQVLRRQGGWHGFAVLVAVAITMAASANEVFLLPVSNILWRTAPSANFEVPVYMPHGASSATLVVSGCGYRQEYTGIADGMFRLSLPEADSGDNENVYDLTLTFNDEAATTRSAKIAVVGGASPGDSAEAFVRSADSVKWSYVSTKNTVLPIPSGVEELSVNGATVNAGLYEVPGWFLFQAQVAAIYNISLAAGGGCLAEATLYGTPTGFKFILK